MTLFFGLDFIFQVNYSKKRNYQNISGLITRKN